MRFSYQWLKQWLDIDLDAGELADRLTATGLEVDAVTPVATAFSGVCVAEITACEAHPDADKLKLCRVETGDGKARQVVCGAPNAAVGLRIPFAEVGAVIGEDFRIKKAKLRGVESFGMACSAKELGLSDDHSGLMALPPDAPLGMDFREYLQLNDVAIALDLTPNRADCLGMRGLAQEISASCEVPLHAPEITPVAPTIEDTVAVDLQALDGCPRYVGRVIRGINTAAVSPLWMVERLRRSGVRSISAVVDITNYVMLELGQPMHAFDLDRLQGSIVVRQGRAGEQVTLLDEKVITLDDHLLAICDDRGAIALAGIMGGHDTGVVDETSNVFLESAWFAPASIAGRARDLGLHTDASHRFERGVDPAGQERAIERMTALLIEIAGGQAGPVHVTESVADVPKNPQVSLRLQRLNRLLGHEFEADTVTGILQRLGMETEFQSDVWTVRAPSNRFDIAIEEDLIEEVARIHGYDALPAKLPGGDLQMAGQSEQQVALTRVRDSLCAAGYSEAINYSFVDEAVLKTLFMEQHALELANPISTEMKVMRTALLPGLLGAMSRNLRRQHDRVRLFETGVAFLQRESMQEVPRVAGVVCGSALPEQWGTNSRAVDFYDLKNDIEGLLALRGESADVVFESRAQQWLHPGQSAAVLIDGQNAGWAGALHPAVLTELDIKGPVYAFELDLEPLLKREVPNVNNISRFPSVRRDLAFLVPDKTEFQQLRDCVTEIAGALLKDLLIFDVFSGNNVEKGYKSIAIGLILQDVSCTLTDEVVDPLMQEIIQALTSRLNAQHRG